MKRISLDRIVLASLGLVVAGQALGQSAPSLRFDPFRSRSESSPASAEAPIPDAVEFEPVLRSIVVVSDRSLVNLGGEILFVGDESHGYRLVEARAYDADFMKDGQMIRLELSSVQEGTR